MAKKRATLPKDFQQLLSEGDIDRLKGVFEGCSLDARGGYSKQSALAFTECPETLIRWLVDVGADLGAEDQYDDTPLHAHAGSWRGSLELLIALGAEVDRGAGGRKGTALHRAASSAIDQNVRILLSANASVDALNGHGQTPLDLALLHCTNATLDRTADVVALLLEAGARTTPKCRDAVTRIGENFEFHRSNFNPETVDGVSQALDRLYALFDVPAVPGRSMHDGTSPIIATAERWEDRFEELWQRLVPSSGAARTVQGEVLRIAGKIRREVDGNGGVNWDREFNRMADAWLAHVGSGTPLNRDEMADGAEVVADAKARTGDMERLCELAVGWVDQNPKPVSLPPPPYDR